MNSSISESTLGSARGGGAAAAGAAGFGGFLWGNPGETIAYGTFVLFGAKLVF